MSGKQAEMQLLADVCAELRSLDLEPVAALLTDMALQLSAVHNYADYYAEMRERGKTPMLFADWWNYREGKGVQDG